jgi:energy-coupling factor transporter ATP-binding protein EcfA2
MRRTRRPPAGGAVPSGPVRVRVDEWGWRHAGRSSWAVHDLSLEIQPGERVLLLGASGSGKSTLLAGLAGVLGGDDDGDSTGRLVLDGAAPASVRGRAGLLLQDPEAQTVLARVGDDVAFSCENIGVPRREIWERVEHALTAVGLEVGLGHPTAALSGGQKQRLALAGLLAMRPGLLLLDEPTANLDPAGVNEVHDAVAHVLKSTGATFVVVEHRVEAWLDLVDRVVVLDAGGGVLADGDPEHVFSAQAERLAAAGVWLPRAAHPTGLRPATTPGETMLTTDGLRVARRRPTTIVVPDLAVRENGIVAVTGPNGSGKSTLALTLGGLLTPAGGEVRASAALADGLDAAPGAWGAAQLVTRIGSVFQNPEHQFVAATVRDELAAGPRAAGVPPRDSAPLIDDVLARLRLDSFASVNPFTLSGGQKRRLSVATALVTRPRVLVLDEPTFGQDAVTWRELLKLLAELRDGGAAIVAVTHDEAAVQTLGAEVLRLDAPVATVDA